MNWDFDPDTVKQLRKIKQLKLDSAERALTREMGTLSKIHDDIQVCESERKALAQRRLAIMSDLERSDLNLNDLCMYHARISRSDQQMEQQDSLREELEEQRSDQQIVVSDIRQSVIKLHHRLDQWQAILPADEGMFEAEEE